MRNYVAEAEYCLSHLDDLAALLVSAGQRTIAEPQFKQLIKAYPPSQGFIF